ncbi:TonB-dependent siderophore receptor [Porticoccus sp. W117]|uniref:TonB-dependent receptor n=1 Tax=Porticoccus sp. W117 TaxID=3054777 RepID=UPI002598407E|nr:TonB-dependent siderophore receptor [Porticoccus sp. W117]MDM3872646.1 TonB-dependent siderophore receptor [Porticoccus sp. W117]
MKFQPLPLAAAIALASSPAFAEKQNKNIDEEIITKGNYLSVEKVNSIKTPTPIIDVPQSLSIITSEQITERGITSIRGIIDYTPGVNTSQGEGHRDAVVFRGVRSTADFYLDGNRDDVQYYRGLYNVEQVEVLRGPNALLFGRGGTGGIINRVSKKAELGAQFNSYKTAANTFGGVGVEVDTNLATSETSAVRLNTMYERLENHRDFFDGDRLGINPTARFELSEDTTLDLSYEYADHERFIDRGIPTGADGRPVEAFEDTVFADPDVNLTTLKAHTFRAALQHNFSDSVKGNASLFYGDYDKLYQNFYAQAYNPATNVVTLDGYVDTTDRQNLILSTNVVAELDKHTIIVGSEYIDTSSDQDRFNPVFSTTGNDREQFLATRPLNFSGGTGVNAAGQPTSYTFSDLNDDTRVSLDVFSLYIQDQIEISEQLDILVGARFDSFDIEVNNVDPDSSSFGVRTRKDTEVSPRAGIIYKPQENVSIYASYSESFLPRSGEQFANINGNNNALDPDTFENREIGLKWDFAEGLSFTAALFENEQSSPQPADNDPSTLDVIDSEISGFELQLAGQVNDSWYVSANYSNLDGDRIGSDGLPNGSVPRELPENTFSIWNTFQVNDVFGFGIGATYQDDSFITNSNSGANAPILPSYTRVDASVYYDVSDDLRIQLNIENLTDELYFPNSHSTHQATVGAPINAMLTVTGKF